MFSAFRNNRCKKLKDRHAKPSDRCRPERFSRKFRVSLLESIRPLWEQAEFLATNIDRDKKNRGARSRASFDCVHGTLPTRPDASPAFGSSTRSQPSAERMRYPGAGKAGGLRQQALCSRHPASLALRLRLFGTGDRRQAAPRAASPGPGAAERGANGRSNPPTPARRCLTEPGQPLHQPRGAESSGAAVHSAPFLPDKEEETR